MSPVLIFVPTIITIGYTVNQTLLTTTDYDHIGFGKAELIEDDESKRNALDIIMQQYAQGPFEYPQAPIEKTTVIKVE